MKHFQKGESFAHYLDERDPLAEYRKLFWIPPGKKQEECLYFSGNSLGLQPKSIRGILEQELKDWETLGVEGHFHAKYPWMPYHEFLTQQTAHLVGAKPLEVVVMNSLTVNLHLLLVSFYRPTPERFKILIEAQAFPSDQYAVQSQLRFHGYSQAEALRELQPREGERVLRTEDIEALIEQEGEQIALILLGGVQYYTGQAFEMERITRKGHEKGCKVGFDLAHGVGNLLLDLHLWQVDFAVWCGYKYLNGGPGALAGCFVHERYAQANDLPRFEGWWGQDKKIRFQMGSEFHPIPGAEGWQLSNPPLFSMAALRSSLDIFEEVGMPALRAKSECLSAYFDFLLEEECGTLIEVLTPKDLKQRGCQLSLRIPDKGKSVFNLLLEEDIRCDWREPDVIRVAPVPLYNRFEEVYRFVQILKKVLHR